MESKDAFEFQEISLSEAFNREPTNIPTPNQTPPLQDLDAEAISDMNEYSRSFETLLTQNQDLMNRLTIQLKRASNLESRLAHSEKERRRYEERVHSFDDELTVLKSNISDLEISLRKKKDELRFTEVDLGNLHEKFIATEQELLTSKKRLGRYFRYRKRVRHYISKYIKSLKAQLSDTQSRYESIDASSGKKDLDIAHLKGEITGLKSKLEARTELHERDLSQLIETHELALNNQKTRYIQLEENLRESKETFKRAQDQIKTLTDKNIQLQNDLLVQERRNKTLEKRFDEDLEKSQNSSQQHQRESLARKAQIEDLEKEALSLTQQMKNKTEIELQNERLTIRVRAKEIELEDLNQKYSELDKRHSQTIVQNRLLNDQVVSFTKTQNDRSPRPGKDETLAQVEKVLHNLHSHSNDMGFKESDTKEPPRK